MIANSCGFLRVIVPASTVLAGLMVASCVPRYSAPQQVHTTNPSVTYKYRNDQELVQANQSAATFCDRYQSVPRTVNFTTDPDGSRIVVFECVQGSSPSAPQPQYDPNLIYDYRTDQELVDATRNAQIYCMNDGLQQELSDIVTNSDGSKTVTFHCRPR